MGARFSKARKCTSPVGERGLRARRPSCGGKRMTELALHLTEQVIPHVPVRQFVLSLLHRLRDLLAYDHARSLSVFARGVARSIRLGRSW
jgi:hypothetical protein